MASFASHIHFGSGCWEWMGALAGRGYGQFMQGGKNYRAHRYAYEMVNGPIPEGMSVLHSCDNPRCVRHDHLRIGTAKENAIDCLTRGRHSQATKTHCKRGHEFTSGTTIFSKNASGGISRYCKICDRDKLRQKREMEGERQ